MKLGGRPVLAGAREVAGFFNGRAQAARPALIDGALGVAVHFGQRLRIVMFITTDNDRIAGIDVIADPDALATMEVLPVE
jgi:hypothetical protein